MPVTMQRYSKWTTRSVLYVGDRSPVTGVSQVLTIYLGASRHHGHLCRQYTSQPRRLSGQVARGRPFPLPNSASTHAPISVTIDPASLLRLALLRLSIQPHGITHLLLDTHLTLCYASSTQF